MASSVYLGGSGGGGTPASPDTSIQFNNSGAFGGDANLVWDATKEMVGIGHGQLLGNFGPGLQVLADDNTDIGDTNIVSANLNAASSISFLRGNGTLASPSPPSPGQVIGLLSFNALTSSGDYSGISQSVFFQGRVDGNASGGVPAGRFTLDLLGNDNSPHNVFTAGNTVVSMTSLNGISDVGSDMTFTAGDADTGFNGGRIIGTGGGSSNGTTAGLISWTGGSSTSTAKGGDANLVGGASTSGNGGIVGIAGGNGGANGGSVNITGGNGVGGGNSGGDIILLTGGGSGGATNGNLKINGQTGDTTTVTSGSLVGKTMTFTNGILTGFA